MVQNPASLVGALVASIPVDGAEKVQTWLTSLSARCDGKLPPGLRGARIQFPQGAEGDAAITSEACRDGLAELGRAGLHFEFCIHADRLKSVLTAIRGSPETNFVLDHCGLNDSGQDFAAWKAVMSELAACNNLVAVKLSAIEEWKPVDGDPAPYLDHALACFGPSRCMYGGNWFVPVAFDIDYSHTATLVAAAVVRAGLSEDDAQQVFGGTASRVYGLRPRCE
jgi:L-fuconolactonase